MQQIAAVQTKTGILDGVREKLSSPGGKVVESDNVLPEGQKPVSEGAADEAGSACDKSCQWLVLLSIAEGERSDPSRPKRYSRRTGSKRRLDLVSRYVSGGHVRRRSGSRPRNLVRIQGLSISISVALRANRIDATSG